jgi:DNA repair exonuclease SbcCD ATPase subunit
MAINELDFTKLPPEHPLRKQAELLLANQNINNALLKMHNLLMAQPAEKKISIKQHIHHVKKIIEHDNTQKEPSHQANRAKENMAQVELNQLMDALQKEISALNQTQNQHQEAATQLASMQQQLQELKQGIASAKLARTQMVKQVKGSIPFAALKLSDEEMAKKTQTVCNEFNRIDKLPPEAREKEREKAITQTFQNAKFTPQDINNLKQTFETINQNPVNQRFLQQNSNYLQQLEAKSATVQNEVSKLSAKCEQLAKAILKHSEKLDQLSGKASKLASENPSSATQNRLEKLTASMDKAAEYTRSILEQSQTKSVAKIPGLPKMQLQPGNKAAKQEDADYKPSKNK